MCGVLGLVSGNKEINRDQFQTALKKQEYRGPDSSKIIEVGKGLFGFNRLTIQDLSDASMQPFEYKGNWLVFNGEIYNWKELRKDLEQQGFIFKTHGDTEVLCIGLSEEGLDFIKKLNGIFAFCFYDKVNEVYTIARDLMGVKPLYYSQTPSGLVISSDVSSILEFLPNKEINMDTIYSHLFFDWFSGHNQTKTFLKDVYGLKRGTLQQFDVDGKFLKEETYDSLDFSNTYNDHEEIEKVYCEELLPEAFKIESRSDTKVGMLLSGGIDSTSIVALASEEVLKNQKDVPLFTFYYEKMGQKDDFIYATKVVDELSSKFGDSLKLHAYNMDSELKSEDFIETVKARSAPIFDVRNITLLNLYKKVKEFNLKVILNGQGSDEIYYGYYPLDYWLSRFYRIGDFTTEEILNYYEKELNARKFSVYKKEFIEEARKYSEGYINEHLKSVENVAPKEKLITAFFVDTILQSLLLHEDKSSMYSSIEVRVPLINKTLAQYIAKCDFKVNLVSSNSGRHLLRKALKDILSEDIFNRPKSPAPKKKNYFDELVGIYQTYRDEIVDSPLVNTVYTKEFIEDPTSLQKTNQEYAYYGNQDDILLEFLGLFFFEREIINNKK